MDSVKKINKRNCEFRCDGNPDIIKFFEDGTFVADNKGRIVNSTSRKEAIRLLFKHMPELYIKAVKSSFWDMDTNNTSAKFFLNVGRTKSILNPNKWSVCYIDNDPTNLCMSNIKIVPRSGTKSAPVSNSKAITSNARQLRSMIQQMNRVSVEKFDDNPVLGESKSFSINITTHNKVPWTDMHTMSNVARKCLSTGNAEDILDMIREKRRKELIV